MSENRSNDTGQISVAELLARNGQKVEHGPGDDADEVRAAASPSPN